MLPPTAPTPGTTTTVNGVSQTTGFTPGFGGLSSGVLAAPGIIGNTAGKGFGFGTGFLNADGAKAVISFLNASLDAQVTSTPRVVTLDNEPATISVMRTYPILQTTAGTQGFTPAVHPSRTLTSARSLLVTPRISANNSIRLKVSPVVSTFFGYLTLTRQRWHITSAPI
ncbi:MAG: hypothetical protein WDN00_14950 [Limisphaerales bacterium]